jgi:hypothetical protein
MAPLGWATRSMGRHGAATLVWPWISTNESIFSGNHATIRHLHHMCFWHQAPEARFEIYKWLTDDMPWDASQSDPWGCEGALNIGWWRIHLATPSGWMCVPESPRQKCSRRLPFLGLVCDSAGVPLWPWWYHDVIPATVANKCLSGWYVLGLLSKTNNLRIKMN